MPRRRKGYQPIDHIHKKTGVDKNKVVELHKAGLRNGEIAKAMNCSPSRVTNILKEMRAVQKKKEPLDTGKVGALYRAGWSLSMIASEMDCEEEEIYTVLRAG